MNYLIVHAAITTHIQTHTHNFWCFFFKKTRRFDISCFTTLAFSFSVSRRTYPTNLRLVSWVQSCISPLHSRSSDVALPVSCRHAACFRGQEAACGWALCPTRPFCRYPSPFWRRWG